GAMGGASRPNPYQQLGESLGQGIGALRSGIQSRRANKALGDYGPLNDAVDDVVDHPLSAPPMPEPPPLASPPSFNPVGSPLADGKIVTRPTIAIIGENEPEAVVPLSYRPGAKTRPHMALGRRYYGE